MRRVLILAVIALSTVAHATTYYVSSSVGNDNNSGTSAAAPWKTLASVSTGGAHASLIVAGTTVLLARGDLWTESLIPPASGANGNPITFDAYGTGTAPEITGKVTLSGWTQYQTNVWSAPLTAAAVNYVMFGTIWGTKQGSVGSLAHDRDFLFTNNTLYVYATSNPASYYGTVAAIVPLNSPSSDQAIYVNGKSWLTFQHIKLDWFDQFGVNVAGASDHLVFANMESDGMVPAGTLPHGFYVNVGSPGPGDIQFINVDAHMNYDGLRFDGTLTGASAVKITNARAYFNRNYGIDDTTTSGPHVMYSNSHLYGNGIAVLGSIDPMDASGAVSGGNNVPSWTAPTVNNFARYPARITYTIDDEGKSPGGADYIDSLLPQFTSRNLKLSIAVVTGEQYAAGDIPRIQGWLNAGHDINSHSWSHNYYDNPQNPTVNPTMFTVSYAGTSATMTISGNPLTLTTNVTGGPGQGWSFDLTNASYSDFTKLVSAINAKPGYTAALLGLPHGHSATVANVTGVNINCAAPCASPYQVALDPTKFVPDEMSTSAGWLLTNLTGLSSSELVYVYPSGKENYQTQLYAVALDPIKALTTAYKGGRGSLSMGQAIAGTFSTNSGAAPLEGIAKNVYGYGVNIQNITSLGATAFGGMSASQIAAQVRALVNKAKAWGVPYGLFTHPPETGAPELTVSEVGSVLDGLIAAGATVMTNTQLVDYLAAQPQVSGSTMAVATAATVATDLRPNSSSASVLKGSNVGAAYGIDLQGVRRPATGAWDVGAYQTIWAKVGGSAASRGFQVGGVPQAKSENAYCLPGDVPNFGPADGPANVPTACTYTAMAGTPSPGAVHTVNASNCNDASTGLQYWLNTAAAGDTIVIPASATCSGSYTLPAKTGADAAHWTTIRTDQIGNPSFPAEGVRATPCEINITHVDSYPDYNCANPGVRMPTLIASGTSTVINATGASYYRLIGLNITKPVGTSYSSSLVTLDLSDHVILDRVLVHGVDYSSATKLDTHIGISTRGTHQAIINSWCYDIDWNAADGQCIVGGTGTQADEGPIKIYNNLLAGASENWLFGGGAAVVVPHDFEIRGNLSMKPLKWMIAEGAPYYNVSVNVKNLGEWKQGDRVLMENNVFLNSWEGQSDQTGNAILMMPKSQSTQDTSKYVSTSGTSVSCAADASGTPCAAGAGIWGNKIVSLARTNGVVTLAGANNGASVAWPYYNTGNNIVLQGIQSQVVNGVDMASFNGEWTMGCLNPSTCTNGYTTPRIIYFAAAGPDFPTTTVSGGLAQDLTSQSCALTGHCLFDAPKVNYPTNPIVSVTDTEHITVQNAYPTQTGATQVTCHAGSTPNAELFDFIARYNYISHVENLGFTIGNVISQCFDVGKGVGRISIHDNIADDVDTTAWNRAIGSCCGHGGSGPVLTNSIANPALFPHDILFAHNTWAGMRDWPLPQSYLSENGYGWVDPFNVTYTAATLLRVNNVVTITFSSKSGASQGTTGIVAGFTGSYTDLNGSWPLQFATTTQITYTESGSHADISPAITVSAGTTGAATVKYPLTYYKNVMWRDNIFPGPLLASDYSGHLIAGGVTTGLSLNFCDPNTSACTWQLKNNLIGTALYSNAPQGSAAPYPTTNPDSSAVCTLSGGCFVTDFSSVFANWGTPGNGGMGNTSGNDYRVTSAYRSAASDGKDLGADMTKLASVLGTVPHFTYYPLTIATSSLTPCTNGTYCEQQLLTSSSATTPTANGFVRWRLFSGTLPTGMNLSNGEGYSTCQVNGSYSKTGATGCQGWLWGTPTQSGNFPLTFQVEDAAHQKATMTLTLLVN